MTTERQQRLISDMRGVRYGEVLGIFARNDELVGEVYGTQMINDCPQELWEKLDAAEIAKDLGSLFVKLNGPRYWVLDGLGSKTVTVDPEMREFGGIMMRRIATIPLGKEPGGVPYMVRNVNRGSVFFWDAGKTVYELVDPQGRAFVMQAYCVGVDKTLTEESLGELGSRLALPAGWSFRTRVLEEELIADTSDHLATVVQDELENTYTLPY